MSRAIQVLSEGDLERVNARISLFESQRDWNRSRQQEYDALCRARDGFSAVDRIASVRIDQLEFLARLLVAGMDAVSSTPGQLNIVPDSYGNTLAEFQALFESYGFRIFEIGVSFDPALVDRKGVVEELLAQQPEPEPTILVVREGDQTEP